MAERALDLRAQAWDAVVVGAGTAGAAAAAELARRGLRTLCVDSRPLDHAGARWVNAVPSAHFDLAGIPRPAGGEHCSEGHRFHIVAGWGPERVTVEEHGAIEVDMRLLVERLHRRAEEHGATLCGGVRIRGLTDDGVSTDAGTLRARWVIDASGLAGADLSPRPVAREDICAAAQEVRDVADRRAAEAFFTTRGVAPGDTLCFTSIAGGFSIVNVRLEHDGVSILTGSIPALGHPSGLELLGRFVKDNPWIGARRFGGARPIPLSRAPARLVNGRLVRIGDAAGHVFAAHGSGIGAGLIAAPMLADALAQGTPHAYTVAWQRRFGGTFAAYDVFRRFSSTLSTDDLRRLMRSGVVSSASAAAAMQQVMPSLDPQLALATLRGAAREPALAARFVPALARMSALAAAYRLYPQDEARVDAWSRWVERI